LKTSSKWGIIFLLILCVFCFGLGFIVGCDNTVKLDYVDHDIIDSAIEMTEEQTGSRFTLTPVFIQTGEFVGFLADVNESGRYLYIGMDKYPSILQEK